VRNFLNSLPGGFWTKFVIVMGVIFILGFFLDFIEIAVVVVPIVAPILLADPSANVTAVWLGVMIGLNIQTSFLTPPFGFALFYLRGVAPAVVRTVQIYKGVIAFIFLQLIALAIVGYYPQLVNYLPNRVSYLSETSPPPRNPQLQICLEKYVRREISQNGDEVRAVIERARALDLSALPRKMSKDLTHAFDSAEAAINGIEPIFAAQAVVAAATPDYRPALTEVRNLENQMRQLDKEMKVLKRSISFIRDEAGADRKAVLEAQLNSLQARRAVIEAQIPSSWPDTYATFSALVNAESSARNGYRRNSDQSVEAAAKMLAALEANAGFFALKDRLTGLKAIIETEDPSVSQDIVNKLGKAFGALEGGGEVRSKLSKVRRALKSRSPDRDKALAEYAKAIKVYDDQVVWRRAGEGALMDGIGAYLDGISDTIGARQQPKLSRKQALYLASCNASHRDVSLSF